MPCGCRPMFWSGDAGWWSAVTAPLAAKRSDTRSRSETSSTRTVAVWFVAVSHFISHFSFLFALAARWLFSLPALLLFPLCFCFYHIYIYIYKYIFWIEVVGGGSWNIFLRTFSCCCCCCLGFWSCIEMLAFRQAINIRKEKQTHTQTHTRGRACAANATRKPYPLRVGKKWNCNFVILIIQQLQCTQ